MSASTPSPTQLLPGLVSVSFRKLSVDEVIALAVDTKLTSIEWGGDVHVPPGEFSLAADVASRTHAAGLKISAYGSYYRAGSAKEQKHSFSNVAHSAKALDTSMIRIWVGDKDSQDAEATDWESASQELRAISREAAELGLNLGMEFHSGTLNNSAESSRRLIESVGAPNLTSFWQTTNRATDAVSLSSLKTMRDWISNIHVFNWTSGFADQTPLEEGTDRWKSFFEEIRTLPGQRILSLEFVRGHDPEQLQKDAATLRNWINEFSVPRA